MKDIKKFKTKRLALSDLKPDPGNPRSMPTDRANGLMASIERFGLVQPIIVNERTWQIVGGHQRVVALEALGQTDAWCIICDLSEDEQKALNLALNNTELQGIWDKEQLAKRMEEVREGLDDAFLDLRIQELAQELKMMMVKGGETDPNATPEAPEIPVTQVGDLWEMGDNRLICGDATDKAIAGRLLDGQAPVLMITDPPYGVEYDPAWRQEEAEKGNIAYGVSRAGEVENDERVDWGEAFASFPCVNVLYCWYATWFMSQVQDTIEGFFFVIRSQIIWAKPNFAISRGHYHWRHEPCWYAVRKGKSAGWIGDRKQTTIWEITLDKNVEGGHYTQKPVECMRKPMANHEGDVVDPFMGSGTTIIAAEQLERRCFGMEINPAYVDVSVRRWQNFTGKTARRYDEKGQEESGIEEGPKEHDCGSQ